MSYSFLPVWWCSWPETCRLISTPTSPTSSPSSPRCWTPKTRSSLSGLSPPSRTCTSTFGGWWWKTWATSTSQCADPVLNNAAVHGLIGIFWVNDMNALSPLHPPQFIQHAAGTQEGAHSQVRCRELLFFDAEGESLAWKQHGRRILCSSLFVSRVCYLVPDRFQMWTPCWATSSQICTSTRTKWRGRVSCSLKCAKEFGTCFTPALTRWVVFYSNNNFILMVLWSMWFS